MSALGLDSARFRLTIIGLVVVALFAAVFVRLWYLQVLSAPTYQKRAVVNNVRTVYDPATRGVVVSRNGTVLVGNQVTETVTLSQNQAVLHPKVIDRVAKLLGITPLQVKQRLNSPEYSPYRPVPIASGVAMSTVIELRDHQSEYPGVSAQPTAQAEYPYGSLAAQLLGYTGPISASELKTLKSKGYLAGEIIGQDGVQAAYDQYLQGKPGVTRYSVDAQGQVVSTLSKTPAVSGDDVQLTLDMALQQQVQTDLQNQMNALRGTTDSSGTGLKVTAPDGAAVVLDPNNGQVLAMASIPTYDPSVWTNGISEAQYKALTNPASGEPLINRAIAGLYTPGSTFKISTASAALQTGLISPSFTYNDTGSFTIPNCTTNAQSLCTLHDAEGSGLGPINVTTALAASVDSFFYNLGYLFYGQQSRYGPSPIQTVANEYGLGVTTGIDLPGEASGWVDSAKVHQSLHSQNPTAYPNGGWYLGDQLEMAFGQGGTIITPLQLATAYATFANGGTRYVPQVVSDIVDPATGKVVKQLQPVVAAHVSLSAQNRQALLQGFQSAVDSPIGTSYGTFQGFPLSQFPVAGKTGTASHTGKVPTALWAGFAPVNNPKYVVAVVIDQSGYGAVGAAPVAKEILQYLMTNPPSQVTPPTSAQLGQPSASVAAPSNTSTTGPGHHTTQTTHATLPAKSSSGTTTTAHSTRPSTTEPRRPTHK